MDKNVDPCDDFYRFACGGYLESQVIPDDQTSVSSFEELESKLSNLLRKSMEQPTSPSEPRPFGLAKDLYKSCMNTCEYSLSYLFLNICTLSLETILLYKKI